MGEKELQDLEKMGKQKYGRRYKFCVVCASAVFPADSTTGMFSLSKRQHLATIDQHTCWHVRQ
jgi:hypothetical protein